MGNTQLARVAVSRQVLRWSAVRGLVSALLLVAVGCASDDATSWRTCDDAYSRLERPAAPEPSPDLRPIEAGDRLPVLRTTVIQYDADSLANRALALACVLTDDSVEATDALVDWAEVALTDDFPPPPEQPLFNADLAPSYRAYEGAPSLEMRVVHSPDSSPAPPPDDDPGGIGDEAAADVANLVRDRLADAGLISEVDYPLLIVGTVQSAGCGAADECSPPKTLSYFLDYYAHHGGIFVGGTRLNVQVNPDGSLEAISVPGVHVGGAGEANAVLSESDAAERFDMLMQERWPDREIVPATGDVMYMPPQPGVEASAPVWLESFELVFPTTGPQRAPATSQRSSLLWLSLTDPDAVPVTLE